MKNIWIAIVIAAGISVVACGKEEKAADTKASTATVTAGGDGTGVAACDDYIKKYEKCLSGMPAETKGAMETAFKQQREGFKQAAATAGGKETLATTCKAALDALASNPACK